MEEKKNYICIKCPRGCEIKASLDGSGAVTELTGNSCRLGIDYVKQESINPVRTLTTTVKVEGGNQKVVPVWTEKPIAMDKIIALAQALDGITLKAPVKINQIVMEDALGTGTEAHDELGGASR